MLQNFDNRALGPTDAYGQRFLREGTYRYDVAAAGCGELSIEYPHKIRVSEGKGDMEQHTVMLATEKGRLRPDPSKLSIKTGDLVTWACREQSAPAFEVVGDHDFFGSARLFNESGYAHAFGTAGEYTWMDAYGSGLSGTVRVVDPRCRTKEEFAEWQARLGQGQLVMISGSKAEPADVEILTGQTIYFAVTKSPGISITDSRLAETIPPSGGDTVQHNKKQAAD